MSTVQLIFPPNFSNFHTEENPKKLPWTLMEMHPFLIYIYKHSSQPSRKNSKMANLMKKSSKDVIGKSKSDTIHCKKHPKHRQSPGVCSLCLKERLAKLSTSSSSRVYISTMESYSSSSSLSSYYSSSEASSCASPMHRHRFTEGKNNNINISLSTFLLGSKNVLTKSRSLVVVSRTRRKEGDNDDNKKKKGGFLSKLLRPRSNKKMEAGLVHSRTVREIVVTSWVIHHGFILFFFFFV